MTGRATKASSKRTLSEERKPFTFLDPLLHRSSRPVVILVAPLVLVSILVFIHAEDRGKDQRHLPRGGPVVERPVTGSDGDDQLDETVPIQIAGGRLPAETVPLPLAVDGDIETSRPAGRASFFVEENPDLARWETERRRRRAALRLEKARASPDVTVSGGLQRFEETDDETLVFGLAVPLPLFDRNQGNIAEATANLARTQQESEAARVKVRTALNAAGNALVAAHDEVTILRTDVLPAAHQAFDAARQGYEQGKFDYLYVLDAQRTLFETRAQLIDSVEAYHKARADAERLIGRSLETLESSGSTGPLPAQTAKEDSHER